LQSETGTQRLFSERTLSHVGHRLSILRLAMRRKSGILQEHVIVSARSHCYSRAGRFVLPPFV